MRIQRLLLAWAVCAGLGTASGCANRSAYPQYPQQAYPYPGQPNPGQFNPGQPYAGQPGLIPIQQSPQVGQPTQGTMQAGFTPQPNYNAAPANYSVPGGYYNPSGGSYGPPQGYAGPPATNYNSQGNQPFLGQ